MSRADVLVDGDWVQAHLEDPGVVLVEADEDTTTYDKGAHPRFCQARLEAGPAGPRQA